VGPLTKEEERSMSPTGKMERCSVSLEKTKRVHPRGALFLFGLGMKDPSNLKYQCQI
jgi:hypothetical protein